MSQLDDDDQDDDFTTDEFHTYDDNDVESYIDQEEIDELLADDVLTNSDNIEEEDENDSDVVHVPNQTEQTQHSVTTINDTDEDTTTPQPRRSTRKNRQRQVMNVGDMNAKSYEKKHNHFMTHNYFQMTTSEQRMLEHSHNIMHQTAPVEEYDYEESWVMCLYMDHFNTHTSFAQQYLLQEGLKRFGEKGRAAVMKEVKQLHDRVCFTPIKLHEMSREEKLKAQRALIFLTQKRDESIKARQVFNGKPTRDWLSREDSASPTASLESLMLLGVIDAKEGRDVMCVDIPNAFIQAPMEYINQEMIES